MQDAIRHFSFPPSMPQTHFISDLHLCESRPALNQVFFRYLSESAPNAEALYILGDLFEYWIGDDNMDNGLNRQVVEALAALARTGTRVHFMHGNRDFLLGARFAQAAQLTLLQEQTLIDLYGSKALLMHGDTLCTVDVDYQRFRAQVRAPGWQAAFLAKPLLQRRAEVEVMRRRSEASKQSKPAAIMDVSNSAIVDALRIFAHPPILIHGHTHRPRTHQGKVDGVPFVRHVLPDWTEKNSVIGLCVTAP
jgi:UDP-2,3-diacylglucosamine hydrolase